MNPREVARAARQSIEIAHERLQAGDALLVFAEGTRSRTRAAADARGGVALSRLPTALVLPVGITGTEATVPDRRRRAARGAGDVEDRPPIDARVLRANAGGDRRLMMDAVGLAIAAPAAGKLPRRLG